MASYLSFRKRDTVTFLSGFFIALLPVLGQAAPMGADNFFKGTVTLLNHTGKSLHISGCVALSSHTKNKCDAHPMTVAPGAKVQVASMKAQEHSASGNLLLSAGKDDLTIQYRFGDGVKDSYLKMNNTKYEINASSCTGSNSGQGNMQCCNVDKSSWAFGEKLKYACVLPLTVRSK